MAVTTAYERTVYVPDENRIVFVLTDPADIGRVVYVSDQNRTVYVLPSTTSAERTVYATED